MSAFNCRNCVLFIYAVVIVGRLGGQVSETESVCDTGDEDILEAVMRTAAASSSDRRPRDKRKSKDSDSKSCKSSLSNVVYIVNCGSMMHQLNGSHAVRQSY